ncbi:probable long-chain-alcohol O-fatty-acyltransferase 5 [Olea europaea var. sylvestris]|uniref:Probable long-chain-alcohol O-fatty-acyltransferase 5 n=1 Tax=Olea europaea subsp. europaea TaxID=158383 RepID=A0A8S0PA86_OLEEU|nr:probable long-chain-alcohol O-fatty-acyltransferase 5 [Olea europaea var. sylvestris]CAA2935335.1 probable long-chain-alcohol O-fatty-acyltransferase 5 [Olea europaea subsp. europaea]
MEDEIKNLAYVWFTVMTSLCYCYFISAKFPKGLFRFMSLIPIFSLYASLPLSLKSAFFTAVTAFLITWLTSFKLLLFAFNQGPLTFNPTKPPLHVFIAIAALPIKIKQNKNSPVAKSPKKVPLNLATETVAFSILIAVIREYKDYIPPKILLIVYCCLAFLLIDLIVALSSFLVRVLAGLELEPPSDEPYLSTSLQEFWGRRWNLIVTNTLRHTVYKPVRSASATVLGNNLAPLVAVVATFIVSGLMHELLFYYVTRVSPSWEMTLFFVLHGVCVVVEFRLKAAFGGKWRLPWFVSGTLTVGFVVATSFWLFFPPLTRNGADVMVIEEFIFFGELVKKKMLIFLARI